MAKKKMGLATLAALGIGGYIVYKKFIAKKAPTSTQKAQAAEAKSKFMQPGPTQTAM